MAENRGYANSFDEVRELLDSRDMKTLKLLVNDMEPVATVRLLEWLQAEDQGIVFRLLDKDRALEIFELAEPYLQEDLLSSLADDHTTEFFAALEPDDRVRLMDELPARLAKKLLAELEPRERELTNLLLGFSPETAGRIMTPRYIRLSKDMTVEDARNKIRSAGRDLETLASLFVTDRERKLEGCLALQDLVLARDQEKVGALMDPGVTFVHTNTDQEMVVQLLREADLRELPVVDREYRLVGVITVDDALDILELERTEDLYERVGLVDLQRSESDRSHALVSGNLASALRMRLPFLLITLAGGIMAGMVMEQYEAALETIVAVAFFVPVVMDMGGNVGTQSSTIFARALVLGQIHPSDFLRHWMREIRVGACMGLVLGVLVLGIAYLWQGSLDLGLAVGISLVITMTLATALGFLIPYTLVRLGWDQAAGSDPIITSVKDITGLFIYFSLVMAILL